MHFMGFAHQDLKMKSILISEKGSVKSTDFGLRVLSGFRSLTRSTLLREGIYLFFPYADGRHFESFI
jgi:serine/threonine protein kinase